MAEEIALELNGVRVRWDAGAVAAYPSGRAGARLGARRIAGPGPLGAASAIGGNPDGSILLLAALRPVEADAHGDELAGAVLIEPDGNIAAMDEVLLSTEYAGDGAIRRVTLELYREGDDYPLRGAGDAASAGAEEREGRRVENATLRFRLDGSEGAALYEIVHA